MKQTKNILVFLSLNVIAHCWKPGLEAAPDFNRDIRPILSAHCYACHGPDTEAREANLRLDTSKGALSDLGGYAAIVPGSPKESALIARIETKDLDDIMPPPDHGEALSLNQRNLLHQWIEAGANYQKHWSFVKPVSPQLPEINNKDWPTSPLDHFVLAQMEARSLTPSPPADRATWIRRVSLDVTGLPPSIEEATAFIQDDNPHAFTKVVDRLLGSESFGEHWARMWLDLARYADTKGYEKDRHRDIWMYREWVIHALNDDMPFDQFTMEQLAGDLLPNRTDQQIIATAFHRNTMTNEEGGTDNEEFRIAAVKDRVDTTIQVWMGLTMGCAKCHSHKYDPITLKDYYSFYAFFNQTQDNDQEGPYWSTPTTEQKIKLSSLTELIKKLETATDQKEHLNETRKRLKELESKIPKTPILLELSPDKNRKNRIHQRGNFLNPGAEVNASLLPLFNHGIQHDPKSRQDVARWLIDKNNPLTARVMVNRVWARIFGKGLVETEEDFGTQGLAPSHPKMLDWLAVKYREQGWSLKQLVRTIVLSKTYQQKAHIHQDDQPKDPRNKWLSRGPRFRLSAEMIRDQALTVSGLLTHLIGGPSVMPPQPSGLWKTTYSGEDWKNAVGPDRYRRAIYTYLKRTSPHPTMTTFDAGSGEVCQIRRIRTNTPLQALVTLNDTAFLEAAGALSLRMSKETKQLDEKITKGFRLLLIRHPEEQELARLMILYDQLAAEFKTDPHSAKELLKAAGIGKGDPALVGVANVLLNLDEALTK